MYSNTYAKKTRMPAVKRIMPTLDVGRKKRVRRSAPKSPKIMRRKRVFRRFPGLSVVILTSYHTTHSTSQSPSWRQPLSGATLLSPAAKGAGALPPQDADSLTASIRTGCPALPLKIPFSFVSHRILIESSRCCQVYPHAEGSSCTGDRNSESPSDP